MVDTILSMNAQKQSLASAGDLPEVADTRLKKANVDCLIYGGGHVAISGHEATDSDAQMEILIGCVGRRKVLNQRVEKSVAGVRVILGSKAVLAGLFSYGGISPSTPHARCELHNPAMTINTLAER